MKRVCRRRPVHNRYGLAPTCKQRSLFALVIAGLLLLAAHASASVAVFQQGKYGYQGVEDTCLFYSNYVQCSAGEITFVRHENENYGTAASLTAGYYAVYHRSDDSNWWQVEQSSVGLIRFDLSDLRGQCILSSQLRLYLQVPLYLVGAPYYSPWSVGAKSTPEEDADWVVGTGNGVAQPGASCYAWKQYDEQVWSSSLGNRTNWLSNGCITAAYTGVEKRFYDQYGSLSEVYQEVSLDLPPSLLASWADSVGSNGGLVLYGQNNTMEDVNTIASSDSTHHSIRPLLTVNYVTPEPSGFLALIAGISAAGIALKSGRRYGTRPPSSKQRRNPQ